MKHKIVAFFILFACCRLALSAFTVSETDVDGALDLLDKELDRRQEYVKVRQHRIDSIRQKVNKGLDHETLLGLTMKLGDEYSSFNTDSAEYYYNKGRLRAEELGKDSLATSFKLKQAATLPLAAFITEAQELYNTVDPATLSGDLLDLYYDSGRQMYSYIAAFYADYPEAAKRWQSKSLESQRLLLDELDSHSARYKLNRGEYALANGEYDLAEAAFEELMAALPNTDNLYARAAHNLADVAKARGDVRSRMYYLTLSAIGDVKSATLEVVSLQELGELVYDAHDQDVARAHRYLSTALDNAVQCHASLRMIQTAEALPIIGKAQAAEIDEWRQRMYLVMGGMALLVVVLIVVLLVLRHEMKRMRKLQTSLRSANDVKEVYISQFLNLCSIYMDKLNQLCKTVNRKIATNKVDDLYKLTKSGKFVEEESAEFYKVFDDAFLHIFPSFVDGVNALLRPDEQIVLKDGELLNTDLRILAFMRLGIEESTRIAQILNYSVYTIYTYRNKLKNRAIDRENFEANVMRITSIDE